MELLTGNEDGNFRPTLTINGDTPGPLIWGYEGDTLRVHVTNNLLVEATMHWYISKIFNISRVTHIRKAWRIPVRQILDGRRPRSYTIPHRAPRYLHLRVHFDKPNWNLLLPWSLWSSLRRCEQISNNQFGFRLINGRVNEGHSGSSQLHGENDRTA